MVPFIGLVLLSIFALTISSSKTYEVPHPFECGSDETCYCEKSPNCGRKRKDS